MPYDAFRHRFRKLMGVAPIAYQLRCRMEQASLLLRHRSVKETAAALGYGDPYVFSRQFKAWSGQPPAVWQRRARTSAKGEEGIVPTSARSPHRSSP